jgi:YfiH family protein
MNALPVLTSPLLDLPGVRHAFFTRNGGVSEGVYDSLNIGRGSNDDPQRVLENRRRAAGHFGVGADALLTCYQIHSAEVVAVDRAWDASPEADGVATAKPDLVCGALAADCAPILLADPEARVVAAAHAGWKGALGGVAEAAVARMVELGAEPARITAVIGPCISPASYEVGLEFMDRFVAADAGYAAFFGEAGASDKRMFDLPGFVLSRLRAAGVGRCDWIGRDTCAEADAFYSNRRAFKRGESDYGRLLSAIMLV